MFEDALIATTSMGDTESRRGIYRDVDRDLKASFEASLSTIWTPSGVNTNR